MCGLNRRGRNKANPKTGHYDSSNHLGSQAGGIHAGQSFLLESIGQDSARLSGAIDSGDPLELWQTQAKKTGLPASLAKRQKNLNKRTQQKPGEAKFPRNGFVSP